MNLMGWLRAIEAAPAVLQLVVTLRSQILQFLCEFFGFDVRYHALHSQLLTLPILTHIARFAASSQSLRGFTSRFSAAISRSYSPSNRPHLHKASIRASGPPSTF